MVGRADWIPATYRLRTGRSCPTELTPRNSISRDHRDAVLLSRPKKVGQSDRTCTCMISLPRGVADYLAPHSDWCWKSEGNSSPAKAGPADLLARSIPPIVLRTSLSAPRRSLRRRCTWQRLVDRVGAAPTPPHCKCGVLSFITNGPDKVDARIGISPMSCRFADGSFYTHATRDWKVIP